MIFFVHVDDFFISGDDLSLLTGMISFVSGDDLSLLGELEISSIDENNSLLLEMDLAIQNDLFIFFDNSDYFVGGNRLFSSLTHQLGPKI